MHRVRRLILSLLLGLTGALIAFLVPPRAFQAGRPPVWITAVHPDGVFSGEPDEAVQLTVLGTEPIDLSGWTLRDRITGTGGVRFPAGFLITPPASLWIAHHALSFTPRLRPSSGRRGLPGRAGWGAADQRDVAGLRQRRR
jgi:hypothetical protein